MWPDHVYSNRDSGCVIHIVVVSYPKCLHHGVLTVRDFSIRDWLSKYRRPGQSHTPTISCSKHAITCCGITTLHLLVFQVAFSVL